MAGQREEFSGDVRQSRGRGFSKPGCQEKGGARDDEPPGRGQAFIDKNAGLPRARSQSRETRQRHAQPGPGGTENQLGPALRRAARMEPAAGLLSPRPFPRAAAPPAPPAGPGPPSSASPRSEPEVLAGSPAPDPGRLITDACSGRTYIKGRLLGKVDHGGFGVALTEVEGSPPGPTLSLRELPDRRILLLLPLGGLRPLL